MPLALRFFVPTSLLLANWKTFLSNYHENIVVDFLTYGWPINYTACTRPVSSSRNHPSTVNFDSHVQAYIDTELSYNAIVVLSIIHLLQMILFALLSKLSLNEAVRPGGL